MICLAGYVQAQEFPVRPYIDPAQLDVPFGKISYYKQPWRAYQDSRSGYDFLQGIGINYNVNGDVDLPVRLLAETGFKAMRIEIGWSAVNWDETGIQGEEHFKTLLERCRQYHIRPTILLNAHQGRPCPMQTFRQTLASDAPAGSASIHLNDTSRIVPGRTGIDNLRGFEAAWAFITGIDPQTGDCRLSRPLPKDLKAGDQLSLSTLKYLPLYPVGTPQFEETAAGWVRYAQLVCRLVRDAGIRDFDLEIWNELTFGSDFININKYYQPKLVQMPDFLHRGGSAWELAARTVAAIKPEYPGIRMIWGFSNTTFFHTKVANLPPGIDGQSYHPYGTGLGSVAPEKDQAHIGSNLEGFVPTMRTCRPEGWTSTFTQTESLLRLLNPQAREQHPAGVTRFYHYMTEHGVLPSTCGVHDAAGAWQLKAKGALRSYCFWLNKGIDTLELYAAEDKQPTGWGILPPALSQLPPDSSFATVATPAMLAIHNLTQAFAGSVPLERTRPLDLDVIALGEQHQVFAGDSTHPPLWDRDVFAALPFQVDAHRFIIAVYTKTYDITSPPGEEQYRLTIRGLPAGKPRIELYDPLQNTKLPSKIIGAEAGSATIEFSSTDYPRLLIIDTAGAA